MHTSYKDGLKRKIVSLEIARKFENFVANDTAQERLLTIWSFQIWATAVWDVFRKRLQFCHWQIWQLQACKFHKTKDSVKTNSCLVSFSPFLNPQVSAEKKLQLTFLPDFWHQIWRPIVAAVQWDSVLSSDQVDLTPPPVSFPCLSSSSSFHTPQTLLASFRDALQKLSQVQRDCFSHRLCFRPRFCLRQWKIWRRSWECHRYRCKCTSASARRCRNSRAQWTIAAFLPFWFPLPWLWRFYGSTRSCRPKHNDELESSGFQPVEKTDCSMYGQHCAVCEYISYFSPKKQEGIFFFVVWCGQEHRMTEGKWWWGGSVSKDKGAAKTLQMNQNREMSYLQQHVVNEVKVVCFFSQYSHICTHFLIFHWRNFRQTVLRKRIRSFVVTSQHLWVLPNFQTSFFSSKSLPGIGLRLKDSEIVPFLVNTDANSPVNKRQPLHRHAFNFFPFHKICHRHCEWICWRRAGQAEFCKFPKTTTWDLRSLPHSINLCRKDIPVVCTFLGRAQSFRPALGDTGFESFAISSDKSKVLHTQGHLCYGEGSLHVPHAPSQGRVGGSPHVNLQWNHTSIWFWQHSEWFLQQYRVYQTSLALNGVPFQKSWAAVSPTRSHLSHATSPGRCCDPGGPHWLQSARCPAICSIQTKFSLWNAMGLNTAKGKSKANPHCKNREIIFIASTSLQNVDSLWCHLATLVLVQHVHVSLHRGHNRCRIGCRHKTDVEVLVVEGWYHPRLSDKQLSWHLQVSWNKHRLFLWLPPVCEKMFFFFWKGGVFFFFSARPAK